jgi:2-polyprenyl-6-hydroxyphenyl methylase/3-demethylubiquinone-9 3-methyltransferase
MKDRDMQRDDITGYKWGDSAPTCAHAYLLPALLNELGPLFARLPAGTRRLFDLGCGNGSVAVLLSREGWDVTGVDPSTEGIARAKAEHPDLKVYEGSAYEDLSARFGQFPLVISLEVAEHVYFPRRFATTLITLVQPGGTVILSTPYHGYWKNLVMALTGKLDAHFTALWDHGHIKFWSIKTLDELLREAGFVDIRFKRVGRVPVLAKSMVAIAKRPSAVGLAEEVTP